MCTFNCLQCHTKYTELHQKMITISPQAVLVVSGPQICIKVLLLL